MAIEFLMSMHRDHPDDAGVLFNLSCAEARAGEAGPALEHLRLAIELDPGFADPARKDADFDSIRDDPRFASALAGKADAGSAGT